MLPDPTVPGIHSSAALSECEWNAAFSNAAHQCERLLPLAALRCPVPNTVGAHTGDVQIQGQKQIKSNRTKCRSNKRLALWRIAISVGAALGSMYRTGNGRPFRVGSPLHFSEMMPHHRAAWQSILKESVRLRDARRSFEMTGGQCLSEILKKSFLSEYTPESQSSSYVDIIADKMSASILGFFKV